MRFQVLFHSPPGVLFTFPSRYWFAIGHRVVFSLSGWSPMIPAGFHVPRRTQCRLDPCRAFGYGSLTLFGSPSHGILRLFMSSLPAVLQPRTVSGLGSSAFAHATYGIDFSFSSCRYLDVSVPCVLPRHDGRHAVSAS